VSRGSTNSKSTARYSAATDLLQDSGYSALVLERLVRHVCRVADVQRACIYVIDRSDPRALIAAAVHGAPIELLGSRIGADEGVLGGVLRTGEPLLVPDCQTLDEPVVPGFCEEATRAALAPIRFEGAVRGVIAAAVLETNMRLDASQIELLCEMSDMAAAALDHASSRDDVRERVGTHVDALAAAMNVRDRCTAEHSEDVVMLAGLVGQMLQLDQAALLELEFAARLHDVGKIRVSDRVLNTPGSLDPLEGEVMRRLVAWGAETLSGVPGLEVVATIVRFHHERWDGDGYPDGLQGACIPLSSRIISVCDAFGAMTADRPYRAGMHVSDAVGELRAGAGTQFDPAVVDAFCEAVNARLPAAHG